MDLPVPVAPAISRWGIFARSVTNGIPDKSYFYFDHSYYAEPGDPSVVAGKTDYGIEFGSVLSKDNVIATQFHPERSQELGLKVLKNFIKWS